MSDRTHRQLKTLSNGLRGLRRGRYRPDRRPARSDVHDRVAARRRSRRGSRAGSRRSRRPSTRRPPRSRPPASTSGSFSTTIAAGRDDDRPGRHDARRGGHGCARPPAAASTLSILGQTPLSSMSDRFAQDRRPSSRRSRARSASSAAISATTRSNLSELGSRTTDLATQLRLVSEVLASGEIEDSLSEIVTVVRLALALLALWFAVPAIAALGFGIWIRREFLAGRARHARGLIRRISRLADQSSGIGWLASQRPPSPGSRIRCRPGREVPLVAPEPRLIVAGHDQDIGGNAVAGQVAVVVEVVGREERRDVGRLRGRAPRRPRGRAADPSPTTRYRRCVSSPTIGLIATHVAWSWIAPICPSRRWTSISRGPRSGAWIGSAPLRSPSRAIHGAR